MDSQWSLPAACPSSEPLVADLLPPGRWIRTFHARQGRQTRRMQRVIDVLGPRFAFDPGTVGDRPVALEIGCGHGDAAIAFAAAHPAFDVVAADVHTPGIAHLLEAIEEVGLANVRVVHGDVVSALRELPQASLARVHLFFPDPWPKKKHHKRRFVRPDLLDLLSDRMADDAEFLLASDVDDYVVWALSHLDEHPAFVGGVGQRPAWRPTTGYHARAVAEGRTVVDASYRRLPRHEEIAAERAQRPPV